MTLLSFSGVAVEFGRTSLFRDLAFTVSRGERWGIVGRNGSGKTTLFNLITSETEPTRGTNAMVPALRIGVMEQHREFAGATSVWEAASGPFAELLALEHSLAEQAVAFGAAGDASTPEMLARYDRDLERFEREGGYTFAPRIDAVLHGLGFDPEPARTQLLTTLSGGERGRVGLVRQLVAPSDLLLLDEPTNHLDLETTSWLEDYLRTLDATVLLISHDRAFLDRVVDHVLHLEGQTAKVYGGSYSAFVTQRAEHRLSQQRAFQKQAKVVAVEEDFIRRNIAGQKSAQAKGRRRRLERLPRLGPPPGEQGAMMLRLEAAERGGDQVLVADRVRLAMGDRVLLEGFSATVRRGDVIGLVGPNGAGKSTLIRGIVGERPTEAGEVRVGESIRVAHYRQDLGQVPADRTLFDIIHDLRPRWTRGQVQGHLGRFGFSGDTVQRRADSLSGGERARVALAMMMLSGANLLVFDEPTNHLDVESIEALEDAIEEYEGTVILVSHDRALLRALCTRVWVLHDRRITDFPGGFAEWETASAERAHAARVAAGEDEAVRRVRERQHTRKATDGKKTQESARRAAERRLAAAESQVSEWEGKVAALGATLEDADLYLTPDGTRRATALGVELEAARKQLERALEEWTLAMEELPGAS
ncbi:MAG: ABC-F family ATP-binding cassette domain-containing protein [Gemmatimonadales bacterium]